VTEPAALAIPALLTGSALAADNQNVVPALISLATVGSRLALHPRRADSWIESKQARQCHGRV
jgi:hypothetical protein